MAIVLVILRIPNTVVDIILILSNFPNDYRVLKSDKVAILVLIAVSPACDEIKIYKISSYRKKV